MLLNTHTILTVFTVILYILGFGYIFYGSYHKRPQDNSQVLSPKETVSSKSTQIIGILLLLIAIAFTVLIWNI